MSHLNVRKKYSTNFIFLTVGGVQGGHSNLQLPVASHFLLDVGRGFVPSHYDCVDITFGTTKVLALLLHRMGFVLTLIIIILILIIIIIIIIIILTLIIIIIIIIIILFVCFFFIYSFLEVVLYAQKHKPKFEFVQKTPMTLKAARKEHCSR